MSPIVHWRGVGAKTYQGDSPVTLGREAIGLALVLERYGASLFGRGAKPAGALKIKKKITDLKVLERLRAQFEQFFGGPENGGKTIILEEDQEFQQLQLTSVDAQFLEQRRFQLAEVSRIWRVPLHFLNELERATHSNAESMGQQFLTFCILPLLRSFVSAHSITLMTPEQRKEYYLEFLVDDLARAEILKRFEAYSKAINSGVLNPNEARAMENRAPYAGGETFMRPVNTAPAPTSDSSGAGSATTTDETTGGSDGTGNA